jgi:UrcA family protein
MYTNNMRRTACSLAITAAVMFGLNAMEARAKDHEVTVALHVSSQGLDLSRPSDIGVFYRRLQRAAWVVCNGGMRADLVPLDDPQRCYEESLGNAIRSANLSALTNTYLATHTFRQAAACGISAPLKADATR